jgi:hypothetical protein
VRGQNRERASAPLNIRNRLLLAGKLGLGCDALAVAAANVAQVGARRRYPLPRITVKATDSARPASLPALHHFHRGRNGQLLGRGEKWKREKPHPPGAAGDWANICQKKGVTNLSLFRCGFLICPSTIRRKAPQQHARLAERGRDACSTHRQHESTDGENKRGRREGVAAVDLASCRVLPQLDA